MKRRTGILLSALLGLSALHAHPLGIFSVNRYASIEAGREEVRISYIMDVAEIPSIAEIAVLDAKGDGTLDATEKNLYAKSKIQELLGHMQLTIDGKSAALRESEPALEFPEGQGGLRTVRLTFTLLCTVPQGDSLHTLSFKDDNFASGRGWKEIIARSGPGARIMSSTVPNTDLTEALRAYPADRLEDPLSVSEATIAFGPGTSEPFAAQNPGSLMERAKDGLGALVSARELTLPFMILALLSAMVLGAAHGLTPGHGKTMVAAYLVGSRGTPKDALILGLTVTATHTAGVFALGIISLFASRYILPGDLYPWLALASGGTVCLIGFSLLGRRLKTAFGGRHTHEHHWHEGVAHTHGGASHTHEAPSFEQITLKSLLALGVSGGLLPCPSALVVLLGAIALGRIGFGILLIVAFSIGLAGVLTAIGLLMVHAGRVLKRFTIPRPLVRWLPVGSACVVMAIGGVMAFRAGAAIPLLWQLGGILASSSAPVLVLGFTLGLKHALDADHLVAVSTIVSTRRHVASASIVGGLWGLGHTLSLLVVGVLVIALHVQIPEKVAQAMEFCVALMLIALGANVVWSLLRGKSFAGHAHSHGIFTHRHDGSMPGGASSRTVSNETRGIGSRPILIGMVHGLAGSAALMLLVLATIPSPTLGLLYIGIFGAGSVGGMMVMSTLLGLPFALSAERFASLTPAIRAVSGTVSLAFGLFLTWQIGIMQGLFS